MNVLSVRNEASVIVYTQCLPVSYKIPFSDKRINVADKSLAITETEVFLSNFMHCIKPCVVVFLHGHVVQTR